MMLVHLARTLLHFFVDTRGERERQERRLRLILILGQ